MSIKLRKIKISDLPHFLKWWKDHDLIALTSGNFDEPDEKLPEYFSQMLESKKDHHYIIQYDEKAIGHLALIHKDSNTFEITIVIGEKEYWNKGIGTKAIKKALSLGFGKLGYSNSYLEVRPENIRAIKAYESCGFVKKGLKKYPTNIHQPVTIKMVMNKISKKIILAGGCFWGMEELIRKQPGVIDTVVGYTGGKTENPTYENHEGHAEAVEIEYNPEKTSYRNLLDFFFQIHNPTTLNRQGNDIGTSYRSAIFYGNEEEKKEAEDFIEIVNMSKRWKDPVVTTLEPLKKFYPAEEYHQDYLQKNPEGYTCHAIYFDSYIK